ncbi:MAG: NAD-dependent malic enzyme [Legionellales bacterium]|nr:NAD-dependent malic enzyme [Legionellales bacterium]
MSKHVTARGRTLLRDPLLNKDTAFSDAERDTFHLYGLLPSNTETIEEQVLRCYGAFLAKQTTLEQHIYLRALQDRNEVLFYRFVQDHLVEMLPIIYTPVVGEACELFHHIYRQPRGLFISYPEADKMDAIFSILAATRSVSVIVVTDGERILGLGDQGTGGLGIPIGKLSLYTVCGGISPTETLPIMLDVGTNNQERLNDPEYLGWRHPRITGSEYDTFVDRFIQNVKRHFPNVLLQFEDFAQQNAYPLLERYRDQLCTFNDDIQGTASVAVAAIIAATNVAKMPLIEQRIALLGAGSAGCGISEALILAMTHQGLNEQEARARFYLVDRFGLLHDEMSDLRPFQQPFAHPKKSLDHWTLTSPQTISLFDVIKNAKPTILLGVSGQPHQFTEPLVREMAHYCKHPIIFPLSNPTSRAEATPQEILTWTQGQALVATGSPFGPVTIGDQTFDIDQCNNSYIFPGLGLGIVAGRANRISDGMFMAAALALSELAPAMSSESRSLLPSLSTIQAVSKHIARAVMKEGIREGLITEIDEADVDKAIQKTYWAPHYESLIP